MQTYIFILHLFLGTYRSILFHFMSAYKWKTSKNCLNCKHGYDVLFTQVNLKTKMQDPKVITYCVFRVSPLRLPKYFVNFN